MNNLPGI